MLVVRLESPAPEEPSAAAPKPLRSTTPTSPTRARDRHRNRVPRSTTAPARTFSAASIPSASVSTTGTRRRRSTSTTTTSCWTRSGSAASSSAHAHRPWRTAANLHLEGEELVALEWGDVDLVAGTLTVRRSSWHGIVGTPKSGRENPSLHDFAVVVDGDLHHRRAVELARWDFGTRVATPDRSSSRYLRDRAPPGCSSRRWPDQTAGPCSRWTQSRPRASSQPTAPRLEAHAPATKQSRTHPSGWLARAARISAAPPRAGPRPDFRCVGPLALPARRTEATAKESSCIYVLDPCREWRDSNPASGESTPRQGSTTQTSSPLQRAGLTPRSTSRAQSSDW